MRGPSKKKKHAYVVDDRRIDVGGLEEVDDSAGRLYAVRACERSLQGMPFDLVKQVNLRVEWMRERPLGVAIMSITASHVLSAAICASDSSPVSTSINPL